MSEWFRRILLNRLTRPKMQFGQLTCAGKEVLATRMYVPSSFVFTLVVVHSFVGVALSGIALSGCNHTLTATEIPQNLTSPGYSTNYSSNDICWWQIISENGNKRVRIDVIASNLEDGFPECEHETLAAYDGNTTSGGLIKRWCGRNKPRLISSDNSMFLVCNSTGSPNQGRFAISYYEESNFTCGGNLSARSIESVFFSPGFPAFYPNNLDCMWHISAISSGYKVQLNVRGSSVQYGRDCTRDYVAVYNGSTVSSKRMGKFCGYDTPHYTSNGQEILVKFHSDASIVDRGFKIAYKEVAHVPYEGCSSKPEKLTATSNTPGYFTSPNYPSDYPYNADCSWLIVTSDSHGTIILNVIKSSLQDSINCTADYVEAFGGDIGYGKPLCKWCGTETPTVSSSGSSMLVKFHTDDLVTSTGFRIEYSQKRKPIISFKVWDAGKIAGIVCGSISFIIGCIGIISYIYSKKKLCFKRSCDKMSVI